MYWVLRGGDPPAGATVAARHARFARSTDLRGKGLVHLVERVVLDWRLDWNRPSIGAHWACCGESLDVRLLDAPLDQRDLCSRCALILEAGEFGAGARCSHIRGRWRGPTHVYYARRDGIIKIGLSRNVGQRMAGLGAELLAVELGGVMDERRRHAQFEHLRLPDTGDSREWFLPGPDLLQHIDGLSINTRAAA